MSLHWFFTSIFSVRSRRCLRCGRSHVPAVLLRVSLSLSGSVALGCMCVRPGSCWFAPSVRSSRRECVSCLRHRQTYQGKSSGSSSTHGLAASGQRRMWSSFDWQSQHPRGTYLRAKTFSREHLRESFTGPLLTYTERLPSCSVP